MADRPRVVLTSRSQRSDNSTKEFKFTPEQVNRSGALKEYREQAWESYNRLKLPTPGEEAWRRTDLRPLPTERFHLPEIGSHQDLPGVPEALLHPLVGEKHAGQVVLTPGGSSIHLEPDLVKKGVVFTDLRTAEKEHPELVARLAGQVVSADEGKFASMAAAFAQNGVVLYVPRGIQVEDPFHSILWGPGLDLAQISHLMVFIDEGASVTYVHEAASPNENGHTLHAGLVEIQVAAGANLRFVELQSWGTHVWNFSHERARVDRDGNLDWIFGAIGSHLTKNFTELDLAGQGSTGRMSGFYFTNGLQHLDHDTQQNHLAPNTTSDLLFKGALKGKSRSVWQGMIYVAPGAQKTDGYQANRNLVLSKEARADSIPGLEILADDVRCSHGATVGKIEEEPLFYIRSRGIPPEEAERLIVEGFFDPIMQRIPFEGVRERFQQAIHEKVAGE